MTKSKIQGVYAIVDNSSVPERGHRELALGLLRGGAKILQLRMKGEDERLVFQTAREILELKAAYHFCFILNDFLEIARELNLDGYHGGKDDATIETARRLLGPKKLVGTSVHSLVEAVEAERRGADYVGFGAVYPSPSKDHEHPVQGVEKLREVVLALRIPVVALGGLGRDNIEEVLATGVAAVAMITALVRAPDTVDEAKFFCQMLANR